MITIVHGPMGCGKTRNAAKLQAEFGCKHVLDLDEFEKMSPAGRCRFAGNLLLLTTADPDFLGKRFPNAKLVEFHTTTAALEQVVPY